VIGLFRERACKRSQNVGSKPYDVSLGSR
jgi:hypothetical protein